MTASNNCLLLTTPYNKNNIYQHAGGRLTTYYCIIALHTTQNDRTQANAEHGHNKTRTKGGNNQHRMQARNKDNETANNTVSTNHHTIHITDLSPTKHQRTNITVIARGQHFIHTSVAPYRAQHSKNISRNRPPTLRRRRFVYLFALTTRIKTQQNPTVSALVYYGVLSARQTTSEARTLWWAIQVA